MVEQDRGDSTQHIRAHLIDSTLRAASQKIAAIDPKRPQRRLGAHAHKARSADTGPVNSSLSALPEAASHSCMTAGGPTPGGDERGRRHAAP